MVISLAREIYGVNDDYYGVLSMDVDISWLMEYAETLQFAKGGYGMIVNQFIYVIAHPQEQYRNLPLQDLGEGYAESDAIPITGNGENSTDSVNLEMMNCKFEAIMLIDRLLINLSTADHDR